MTVITVTQIPCNAKDYIFIITSNRYWVRFKFAFRGVSTSPVHIIYIPNRFALYRNLFTNCF